MLARTLCALCLLASLGAAGTVLAQPLWVGIFGGVDVPSTRIETNLRREGSPSEKNSFAGGAFIEGTLVGPFSLRVGALYVKRQTLLRFPDPINNLPAIDADFKLEFLECPVELKVLFGREGKVRPYLFIGPSFGFRLSARSENSSGNARQEFDVRDQFRRVNFSIDGGGGVRFLVTDRIALSGEARYSYGLINLTQIEGDSWKTRDFRALGGVEFSF